MPMRYADQTAVLTALKIADTDAAKVARVTALENGLAAAFDGLIGRTFTDDATPETRTVRGLNSEVLVVSEGVRSITGIAVDGTWDGSVWADEEPLTAGDWQAWISAKGLTYGIERLGGPVWSGAVRVTGVWGDQGGEGVPADVREALTIATVKEYRRLTSSPTEQIGPDGLVVPSPSGLSDPQVKAAVERYRIVQVIV